jgi:hypothetical protein
MMILKVKKRLRCASERIAHATSLSATCMIMCLGCYWACKATLLGPKTRISKCLSASFFNRAVLILQIFFLKNKILFINKFNED